MKTKNILTAGLIGTLALVSVAKSDVLQFKVIQSLYTKPSVNLIHESGATESPHDGSSDAYWLESPNYPRLNFYSVNNYNGVRELLKKDGRPLESMTTYNLKLDVLGVPDEGAEIGMTFWRDDAANFPGKNIICITYANYDDFNSVERVDDVKDIYKKTPYPQVAYNIQVFNGISKRMDVEFYEFTDLNLDRRVNLEDLALLSWNWGRTGIDTYSPTDTNSYSDINRDGTVDLNDLSLFVSKWLLDYRGSERSPESYLPPAPAMTIKLIGK